jgi:hypothetical protein
MAWFSGSGCVPWAFGTSRLLPDRLGRTHVERLIGTIRQECLDHLIVFGEPHLRRILGRYAAYYNESRIHRSLDKDVPFHPTIERLGVITSQLVLGGLHHQYCSTLSRIDLPLFSNAQSSTTTAHEVLQSRRCPLGSLISKNSESESEGRVARMVMSPVILATPPSSMLKPISRSAASARCRSNFKTRMDHSSLLACCEPNAPSSPWLAEHRNDGRRRADLNLGQPNGAIETHAHERQKIIDLNQKKELKSAERESPKAVARRSDERSSRQTTLLRRN